MKRFPNRHLSSILPSTKLPIPPLSKIISDTIKMTGPVSFAHYMRSSLIHPIGGYYTNRTVFGKNGDFVTSPEISQVFGELMAIWCLVYWRSHMAETKEISILEIGPGRGTLMSDIFRTLSSYNDMFPTIKKIVFVESSPQLKLIQQKAMDDTFKRLQINPIPIEWYEFLSEVPRGTPSIILAHELFDALPIHKFQYTKSGWREVLVDIQDPFLKSNKPSNNLPIQKPLFRLVLSPSETESSKTLPHPSHYSKFEKIGENIEVCPEAYTLTKEIANRIGDDGGYALVVDYGRDGVVQDSVRGIKDHKFVNYLDSPGSCDMTSDVDFSLLKKSCQNTNATAYGPITQSKFLQSLGIAARLKVLLTENRLDKGQRLDLIRGVERLCSVEGGGMGGIYKVLAVVRSGNGNVKPYAFEDCLEDEKKKLV